MANQRSTEYEPRTLKTNDGIRRAILPAYPPSSNEEVPNLLLANVPVSSLSFEQRQGRQANVYAPSFVLSRCDSLRKKQPTESFMNELYHECYWNLQQRWHMDLPIIDYNLARLKKLAEQHGVLFTFNDWPLALEFYLQVDVDLFHWKTSSFRGAIPRRVQIDGTEQPEGIFDGTLHEPQPRYSIQRCHQQGCLCCHSSYPRRHPLPTSAVQFDTYRIHTFVNGYQSILNAPVNCQTSNMIYALTCPCGQFDYLAYTNRSLASVLADHRIEGHRVIRAFLTGTSVNEHRALYEHAARCPTVLQLFLDYHPQYWCFVPMFKNTSMRCSSSTALPLAPSNYEFTPRQREDQQRFFKRGRHRRPVTADTVDLFNATVIVVVPDCSPTMKKFMESLLMTHAECTLNEHGHLLEQNSFRSVYSPALWCQHLIGRPI